MLHDQDELANLSSNALRDYADDDRSNHFAALVERSARHYHEYMKAKEKAVDDNFQSLAIEQTCKICDYSFKGPLPCKCHMRVSADIWQAVIDKYKRDYY